MSSPVPPVPLRIGTGEPLPSTVKVDGAADPGAALHRLAEQYGTASGTATPTPSASPMPDAGAALHALAVRYTAGTSASTAGRAVGDIDLREPGDVPTKPVATTFDNALTRSSGSLLPHATPRGEPGPFAHEVEQFIMGRAGSRAAPRPTATTPAPSQATGVPAVRPDLTATSPSTVRLPVAANRGTLPLPPGPPTKPQTVTFEPPARSGMSTAQALGLDDTALPGRVANALGDMAAHPLKTAAGFVTAPIEAAITLDKAAAEQDAANAIAMTGGDPSIVKRTVTPDQAMIAAAQLASLELGPALGRVVSSVAARAIGETAGRVLGETVAGAGIGAVYSPQDLTVGAVLGGALGGAHGGIHALHGEPVTPAAEGEHAPLPTAAASERVVARADQSQPQTPPTTAPETPPNPASGSAPRIDSREPQAGTSAPPQPTVPAAPIPSVPGRTTRVLLRDGQALPAEYRVVSADALQPSHEPFTFTPNPRYPEGVQGRDYQRNTAAQQAVARRALAYNADIALNPSESAGEGAPTILPDGTVLAGNERTMLVRRAAVHAPERVLAYVDQLKARASSFGIDPAAIDATPNPVLVRVLTDPRDVAGGISRWAEINRLSDEVTTKAKSATEEGAARAAKFATATDALTHLANTLDPEQTVASYLGTTDGREFVRTLVSDGVLTTDELSRLTDASGTLTEDGRLAVRRMLLSTAVRDPAVLLDAPASAVNKLEHAVPSIVATNGTPYATTKVTTEALRMLAEARDHGLTVQDVAAQRGLFGETSHSPTVTALAEFLEHATATQVKQAFRRYAALAREAMGNAESTDMFGGTGFDTPGKAFREAFGLPDLALAEGPLASPRRRAPTVQQGTGDVDLFGEEQTREVPAQRSLFGEDVGTRAAQTDAERLRRWAEAISPEEMAARRDELGAERSEEPPTGPDQGALFSPALSSTPIGAKIRAAIGLSPTQNAAVLEHVQSLATISRTLADLVGVPLREGRFLAAQRRALGAFFPHAEVARVLRFDHLETAAHEIGHFISKAYLQNPTRKGAAARGAQPLPRQATAELVKMGHDLYGSRKPAGGYAEEGIAQWASFYVTDPARMQREAPTFSTWMEQQIFPREPALQAALAQAQQDFADYTAAPATARVASMISVEPKRRFLPDPRTLATNMLDDLREIRLAVDEIGTAKSPEQDAYIIARLTRGAAGAAEEMLERGIVDPRTGKRLAPGYATVLQQLKPEDVQPFRLYLAAERTLEVAQRGIDTGISVADAQAVVQQFAPQFRRLAEQVWQISNALIDYREARGLLTPEEAAFIKRKNQRRVGFYREFDEYETATSQAVKAAFARNASGVKAIKGSARPIIDPLESMITDHYQAIAQGDRAEVMRTLWNHARQTEGAGRIVERLTEVPQRAITIPVERVRAQLVELGFDPDAVDTAAQAGAILSSFEPLQRAGGEEVKDLVMPVVVNGERIWLQLGDRRLYDALLGLGTPQLPTWLRILSFPTRTLRAGATLTGEFIARNPVRDAFTAAAFTRAGVPLPGVDLARGLFHALRRDDLYQQWKLAGGDNASMLGLDRMGSRHALNEYLRSPAARAMGWVVNPIDALRAASSLMENATRIGEFAAVRRKALGRGATARAATTEAAFAARDITVDFARAGAQAKYVNQLVAFFNANVQGMDKLVRELRERPQVVVPRLVALITMPSIGLYLLQKDDPAYQEVPAWQKALAWVIVQRDAQGRLQHIWRIPKPPELGILFGSVPEQLLEWTRQHDPHALSAIGNAMTNLNPLHWPDALAPLLAVWANKDTFTGRPIVPQGATALPAAEQTTSYTGEAARTIGRMVNVSPAKIEALVRGYFGGLGTYGLQAGNVAVRTERSARGLPPLSRPLTTGADQLATVPFVRGFAVREPGMDAESVVRTLADFDRAEAHRLAWRRMLERGDPNAAQYLAQHRAEIASVATTEDAGQPGPLRQLAMAIRQAQQIGAKAPRTQLENGTVQDVRQRMTDEARGLGRMHTKLGPYPNAVPLGRRITLPVTVPR